jgi:DNA polymerase I-like protein with 3'-5' exonuclease and polymerase domains
MSLHSFYSTSIFRAWEGAVIPSLVVVYSSSENDSLIRNFLSALKISSKELAFLEKEKIVLSELVSSFDSFQRDHNLPLPNYLFIDISPEEVEVCDRTFFIPSISTLENHVETSMQIALECKEKLPILDPKQGGVNYYKLTQRSDIEAFLYWVLKNPSLWSIDIETTSSSPYRKGFQVFTVAFSRKVGECFSFGLAHPGSFMCRFRGNRDLYSVLGKVLEDRNQRWLGHNILSFDKPGLERYLGISMTSSFSDYLERFDDTKMMKYALEEHSFTFYRLKSCAFQDLGWSDWGIDTSSIETSDFHQVLHYNCQDVDATLRLRHVYEFRLRKNSLFYGVDLYDCYRSIHMPNALNASILDGNGIKTDIPYATDLKTTYEKLVEYLIQTLQSDSDVQALIERWKDEYLAGRKRIPLPGTKSYDKMQDRLNSFFFDPSKTKQMKTLLFEQKALPYPEHFGRTDKTNDFKVTVDLFDYLAEKHDIPMLRLVSRIYGMRADLSNYIYPVLRNHEASKDGYSHASFRATGTETARYSCKNAEDDMQGCGENLQKIDKRSEIKRLYTSRFNIYTPDRSGYILEIDGQAAEIRIAAMHTVASRAVLQSRWNPITVGLDFHRKHREDYLESASKNNLIRVFGTGEDVHTMGTALIMDKDGAFDYMETVLRRETPGFKLEVSKTERDGGKYCTLGRMYGRGSDAIAAQYGVDPEEMAQRMNRWDNIFPDFTKVWHPAVKRFAFQRGYVTSLFNLVRRIPDIWSEEWKFAAKAEREAINSPVQGDSHIWISKAMSWFQRNVLDEFPNCQSRLINDVHDAFMVDVHPDEFDYIAPRMGMAMMHLYYDVDQYPFVVCPLASDLKIYRPSWSQRVCPDVKFDTCKFPEDTTLNSLLDVCIHTFSSSFQPV